MPASATAVIIHKTKPGGPGGVSGFLIDAASQGFAAEKRSIGGGYERNLLERPFTSASMDYQPFLDITRAEISAGAPWIYVTIFLQKGPDIATPATHAVELDVNPDGRGDWPIKAQPASTDWSTDGVRIYQDANHDVGGAHPLLRDDPPQTGDGYEKLVFDQGNGPDADVAWARISPSNPITSSSRSTQARSARPASSCGACCRRPAAYTRSGSTTTIIGRRPTRARRSRVRPITRSRI